ncbi:ankyrin repeat domain-containing protein [Burkholderia cepacia]
MNEHDEMIAGYLEMKEQEAIDACQKRDIEKAKDLAQITPYILLEAAVAYGYLEAVKFAFKEIREINMDDLEELAMTACENNHIHIIDYFIGLGLDVNANFNFGGYLYHASRIGSYDLVKYLVEKGCRLDDENGMALVVAATGGDLPIVQYLLENGMNVHVCDNQPIKWSAGNRHFDVVDCLLKYGADRKLALKFGKQDLKDHFRKIRMKKKLDRELSKKKNVKAPAMQKI